MSNRKVFEANREKIEAQNAERRGAAEVDAKKVDGAKVQLIRQASNTGQLYGSVSARDLAEALEAQGHKIAKNQIVLDRPIKAIGLQDVRIALHPEVSVTITVNVARSPEEAELQAAGKDVMAEMFEKDVSGFIEERDETLEPGEIAAEPAAEDGCGRPPRKRSGSGRGSTAEAAPAEEEAPAAEAPAEEAPKPRPARRRAKRPDLPLSRKVQGRRATGGLFLAREPEKIRHSREMMGAHPPSGGRRSPIMESSFSFSPSSAPPAKQEEWFADGCPQWWLADRSLVATAHSALRAMVGRRGSGTPGGLHDPFALGASGYGAATGSARERLPVRDSAWSE